MRKYGIKLGGVAALCLVLNGCAPPAVVGEFGEQAALVLDAGAYLFDDLSGSCDRRQVAGTPLASAVFLPGVAPGAERPSKSAVCQKLEKDGEDLQRARIVLGDYFRALAQLAKFNTIAASEPAGVAGSKGANMGELSSVQADSLGKIASLLTEAATEQYRGGHLYKLLAEADPAISQVLQGMGQVLTTDYPGLLSEEERTVRTAFRESGVDRTPGVTLLLNRAFREELTFEKRRRTAARAFGDALLHIREGHALLTQSKGERGSRLTAKLMPHVRDLKRLLPIVREAM